MRFFLFVSILFLITACSVRQELVCRRPPIALQVFYLDGIYIPTVKTGSIVDPDSSLNVALNAALSDSVFTQLTSLIQASALPFNLLKNEAMIDITLYTSDSLAKMKMSNTNGIMLITIDTVKVKMRSQMFKRDSSGVFVELDYFKNKGDFIYVHEFITVANEEFPGLNWIQFFQPLDLQPKWWTKYHSKSVLKRPMEVYEGRKKQ